MRFILSNTAQLVRAAKVKPFSTYFTGLCISFLLVCEAPNLPPLRKHLFSIAPRVRGATYHCKRRPGETGFAYKRTSLLRFLGLLDLINRLYCLHRFATYRAFYSQRLGVAPVVERSHLMHTSDRAIGGAGLLGQVFPANILFGVAK